MAKQKDLTPISYLRYIQVSGYTRKDGRRVEPYIRSTWVVEFPVPLEELDLTDFGKEKFAPRPSVEPPRAIVTDAKRDEWTLVQDAIIDLYDEYEYFELQDAIYRKAEQSDVLSAGDGFIWEKKLKDRSMSSLRLEEIYIVRIWALLYNRNKDEYFVFARARSLLLRPESARTDLNAAYQECLDMYDGLVQWAEESTDYIEVRRMLAWTVWGRPIGEKSPERAPKSK